MNRGTISQFNTATGWASVGGLGLGVISIAGLIHTNMRLNSEAASIRHELAELRQQVKELTVNNAEIHNLVRTVRKDQKRTERTVSSLSNTREVYGDSTSSTISSVSRRAPERSTRRASRRSAEPDVDLSEFTGE